MGLGLGLRVRVWVRAKVRVRVWVRVRVPYLLLTTHYLPLATLRLTHYLLFTTYDTLLIGRCPTAPRGSSSALS